MCRSKTAAFALLIGAALAGATTEARAEEASDLRNAIDAAMLAPPADERLERLDEFVPIGGAGARKSPWTVEAGLALSLTGGNSDKFDLLADLIANYEAARWAFKNKVTFIYGESEGDTTAESWHTEHRVERSLGARTYAFVQGNFDRDEPADLEYRLTGLAGIGRVLYKTYRTSLSAEVGGGVVYEKRVGIPETTDPSAYLGVDYAHEFADGSRFSIAYDFIPNLSDFDLSLMTWDVRFAKPLSEKLDLQVTLRVDYVFEPPPPTESWDIILGVGIRVRL